MSRLSQTCDTHNHIITRIRFLLSNRHQALPSFLPLGRPGGLVGIGVGGRKAWIQKVILNKNKWPQLVRCLVKRDSGCRIFLWPEKAGTQTNKQTHYHTWAALLNSPSTVGIKAKSEGFRLSFFLIAASERREGGGPQGSCAANLSVWGCWDTCARVFQETQLKKDVFKKKNWNWSK